MANVTSGITGHFNGQSLVRDSKTGFMNPGGNWAIAGFTSERKKDFLDALMENPSPGYACKKIQIAYNTYMNHYNSDPEFKKQVDFVFQESRYSHKGDIEMTMLSRAKSANGFMDRMAWLRRHFPGEYNDTRHVQHTVSDSVLEKLGGLSDSYKVVNAIELKDTNEST